MKKSSNSKFPADQDLSKSFKKDTSFKLDHAIEKMSSLLGSPFDLRVQASDLPTNSLEDYVALLNERYNKIVELLTEEEEGLLAAQKENTELKAKLAEEVKNHQDTVSMAKSEIESVVAKNKESLARKHQMNMERQYKEIEIKCNDEKIEFLENEIKKEMENEIQVKDEIIELERQGKFLEEELQSLKKIHQNEEIRKQQLEYKYDEMQKQYEQLKKQISLLKTKQMEMEKKIQGISSQKNGFTEDCNKMIQEQKATLKKTHKNYQKLTEMEKIKKKLLEELEIKNEQLALIRSKNQEMEAKIKGMEFVEKEVKVQEEIHSQLIVENEILNKHLEEISNIMGKHSSSKILNESNHKINIKEYTSLLEKEPNLKNQPLLDPKELLDQNNRYRMVINELEKEIREKNNIIEGQKQKINEMENMAESNIKEISQEIEEKKNLEDKYDEISKKMGVFPISNKDNSQLLKSENKSASKKNDLNNSIKIQEILYSSPYMKEKDEKPRKNENITQNNKFQEYDILNKNPLKLEINELMKSLKINDGTKKNPNSNDLKTLDNI